MMIRNARPDDMPRLKALEKGYGFTFGPDLIEALVLVDAQDVPVMVATAYSRAEVHMATDSTWETPGARLAAFHELHRAMESRLQKRGVGQVVTWFDNCTTSRAFLRRIASLGWVRSPLQSWHRKVGA